MSLLYKCVLYIGTPFFLNVYEKTLYGGSGPSNSADQRDVERYSSIYNLKILEIINLVSAWRNIEEFMMQSVGKNWNYDYFILMHYAPWSDNVLKPVGMDD
jgi:hypothetical protein